MEVIENPFSPGAGSPPPELVGREDILEQARVLFGRVKLGRSEKSMLLTGLRGVGKTVLLNRMEAMSQSEGYRSILLEASEDKPLASLLVPSLRKLLFDLDRMRGAGNKVRRALAVLQGFIGAVRVSVGDLSVGLDIEPERGTADSGDMETDLPDLFTVIAEAAQERETAVAILIDEVQYLKDSEFGALIMAMHKMQQRQLPLVFVGAGLPVLPGLAGNIRSYAERLFDFPEVGALSEENAGMALKKPVQEKGVAFEPAALSEIFGLARGYPYFLQEWGYQVWNQAESSPITLEVVRTASQTVICRLDKNFFRVRFDRLTPKEKEFLRAMADIEGENKRTNNVASSLGLKNTSIGPARANLINKGMIYSPSHGYLAFTVPLFGEFMRRVMPNVSDGEAQG